ncbi:ABC transporter permease subunit, partial [Candidatus Saccharibacteria bacterium]|nr:ABC transporter permease subunit [Candidatus Saccharibacteria bacterium]
MSEFWNKVVELFTTPQYIDSLLHGFWLTLQIAFFAIILGLIIGTIVALIDTSERTKWTIVPKAICKIYTTVIRGTPMALQLFIMFFVIFAIRGFPQIIIAILAFGFNSGA